MLNAQKTTSLNKKIIDFFSLFLPFNVILYALQNLKDYQSQRVFYETITDESLTRLPPPHFTFHFFFDYGNMVCIMRS